MANTLTVLMNYTEMESKVREATNNEPWGSPTSVLQEIANATYNYQSLNEIMPMIYKRFTEKSAEEWRQIYKALQLLEFLIKNGAERVIDDVRSHMSLLKMLRQFHYTDMNGKDQGINVRNRSKELVELLSDVDRIRTERKKSRSTRNKYGGVEGGAGLGGSSSSSIGAGSSSRYGGFGSETAVGGGYGGFSGGVYGDGGGFGGAPEDDNNEYGTTQARRDKFEEYDEGDEAAAKPAPKRKPEATTSSSKSASTTKAAPPPPKAKQPEVDLFDFSADDIPISAAIQPASNGKQSAGPADDEFDDFQAAGAAGDDEFDDFQAAPSAQPLAPSTATVTASTQFAQPAPLAAPSQSQGMNNIYSTMSPSATPAANYAAFNMPAPQRQPAAAAPSPALQAQAPRPPNYQPMQPNYFTSVPAAGSASTPTPQARNTPITSPLGASRPAGGNSDPFASLASFGVKKAGTPSAKGPSMADMARQKTSAGIWGAPATQGGAQQGAGVSGNDLLF